jgi:hemolysin III
MPGTAKMKDSLGTATYSPIEEKTNVTFHAAGLILSMVACVLLVRHANRHGDIWHMVSFGVFGASLVTLYAASTCYHSAKTPASRNRLKIIDHASIYVLIAGTYTPFTVVTLRGRIGWVILSISWGLALAGITMKLFFTGKYRLFSTITYVLMGWLIILFIKPAIESLASKGILWVLAGGLFYTIGAILYSIDNVKFNHAIFHMFVLLGSFCHFIAVFFYVLPIE